MKSRESAIVTFVSGAWTSSVWSVEIVIYIARYSPGICDRLGPSFVFASASAEIPSRKSRTYFQG